MPRLGLYPMRFLSLSLRLTWQPCDRPTDFSENRTPFFLREYFSFKPVSAFQSRTGDMFRAQGRLLTPSELGDRSSGRWWHLENSRRGSSEPMDLTMEDPGFSRCHHLPEDLSPSSDGVRRRMSPERHWKARTSLKGKYSIRKILFQKG